MVIVHGTQVEMGRGVPKVAEVEVVEPKDPTKEKQQISYDEALLPSTSEESGLRRKTCEVLGIVSPHHYQPWGGVAHVNLDAHRRIFV